MYTRIAAITREAETKIATVTVTDLGDWTLFAGHTADTIDFFHPVISGTGPKTAALPGIGTGWMCFALVNAEHGPERPFFLAEQHLPMAGGYNFRDLGGIPGADGKRVVWGTFIRADGLNTLTDDDLAYLASMPVKTLVDFRSDMEAYRSPDRVPTSVKTLVHLPVTPGHLLSDSGRRFGDYESAKAFMLDMYRDLALNDDTVKTYRRFFAQVQNASCLPILFHCTAGKDRTGIAAALILFALGVERELVLENYEESTLFLDKKYAPAIEKRPELKDLFSAERIYLEEALALIESKHGSVLAYLENVLNVDIATIRRSFLM